MRLDFGTDEFDDPMRPLALVDGVDHGSLAMVASARNPITDQRGSAVLPVTRRLLADPGLARYAAVRVRRMARWACWPADPNPMPRFHLFRRSHRAAA